MKASVRLNWSRQKLWMSSSTLAPAHHIGRLYASISGLLNSFSSVDNHAFSDNSVDPSR